MKTPFISTYIFFEILFTFSIHAQNKQIEILKSKCTVNGNTDFDKTILYAGEGITLALNAKDTISYAYFMRTMGSAFYFKGNYKQASANYFSAINALEKTKTKKELALCYNELAKLYRKTKKLKLSGDTYNKALQIFLAENDSANLSMIYNESGVVFEYEGNYDEALYRYKKSFSISQNLKDYRAVSYALNNIAGVYSLQKKYGAAHIFLLQALEIRKNLKDSFSLALNYSDLGGNAFAAERMDEALKYLDSSNVLAKRLHYIELQSQNYLIISQAYAKNENVEEAFLNYKNYTNLKDSIFTKDGENHLNELNTKYQTEKKDLELAKSKVEIINEKNKRFISYGALVFFILISSIIIWAFIQKQKAGKLLKTKNELLEGANKKITHQKEQLSEKQKEILDSINYAKKIQSTLLASNDVLKDNLKEHFLLFKPKDIVSGDFTWAFKKNELFYFACCDSTGHGVPGAFMSLLNIGFINEAVKERNILQPGKIFDYVRLRLEETIGKDGQKDGFDGIIICLDLVNHSLSYSAANNAPFLIRNNKTEYLHYNKMPVGQGIKTDLFDTFNFDYLPGDILYLFTDGFADQFGGPKQKKIKYRKLEELLLTNSFKPMVEQKELLETSFEAWRGSLEQVDDVCVVAIQL